MKNLAASIHARLAQRRTKTGEDYNVLLAKSIAATFARRGTALPTSLPAGLKNSVQSRLAGRKVFSIFG